MKFIINTTALSLALSFSFNTYANKPVDKYPDIYPHVPLETLEIHTRLKKSAETENVLINFDQIAKKGLHSQGKTSVQPWTSTYWPRIKGQIADPYSDTTFKLFGIETSWNFSKELMWKKNYRKVEKRLAKLREKLPTMTTEELDRLAPSEKYDLLLGDDSFDLTQKIWDFSYNWGMSKQKEYILPETINVIGGDHKLTNQSKSVLETAKGFYEYSSNIANSENPYSTYYIPGTETETGALYQAMFMNGGLTEKYVKQLLGKYKGITFEEYEAVFPVAKAMAEENAASYVLAKRSRMTNKGMKTWEGICNGWAAASGLVPRPKRVVEFDYGTITDSKGKVTRRKLRFFPDDIKGLVSQFWVNSAVQQPLSLKNDGSHSWGATIMQGLRCDERNPIKDEYGRFIDSRPHHTSGIVQPRCVGVHPALWYLSLVNLIGEQGRSFIVERKVKSPVDNHPLAGYQAKFFNPYTGEYAGADTSLVALSEEDQFYQARNPKTAYLIGVNLTMTYMDWIAPKRDEVDSADRDVTKDVMMLFDLELDANKNIIGGQWRAVETGKPSQFNRDRDDRRGSKRLYTQPDFFWVISKHYKNHTSNVDGVSEWKDKSKLPPADWKKQAQSNSNHGFKYYETRAYGASNKCLMVDKDKKRNKVEVPCGHHVPKPLPFINVVNALVELAQ